MYKPSMNMKTNRIEYPVTSHINNAKDAGVALLWLAVQLIFR